LRPASLLRAALAFACAAVLALPTLAQDSEGEGAAASAASARAEPLPAGETVAISVPHAGVFGGTLTMTAQVFRPAGDGPFPVVVFSHGRAPDAVDPLPPEVGVSRAQLRYWLARGNAVVSPIRPGYGATGGPDDENNGAHFNNLGRCTTTPDFRRAATAAVRSVDATLAWLRTQPWADAHRVLLVGQSMGGLASVASGAHPPDGVVGTINFAGGGGGSPSLSPGHSCDPDQLTRLYGEFGRATTVPSLWVYAMNDQYFGPDAPAAWHESFARGGSRTTFVHAPALADGDGHGLSRHAQRLWAPYVDAFLATIDFPATGAARH
jgi:dienelactone hydrolase